MKYSVTEFCHARWLFIAMQPRKYRLFLSLARTILYSNRNITAENTVFTE